MLGSEGAYLSRNSGALHTAEDFRTQSFIAIRLRASWRRNLLGCTGPGLSCHLTGTDQKARTSKQKRRWSLVDLFAGAVPQESRVTTDIGRTYSQKRMQIATSRLSTQRFFDISSGHRVTGGLLVYRHFIRSRATRGVSHWAKRARGALGLGILLEVRDEYLAGPSGLIRHLQ